ncbi:gluconokinase [Salinisphaera sp. T31B1]|uniref:gluconokinase n=1 Tax=Salinisphaera sp. T31B1 TaxID=727963 RepID=UPI00333FB76C
MSRHGAHSLQRPRRVVVMGVSGCGKSSLGKAIGHRLQIDYIDGDDYHPQANIDKMAGGEPLTDADRHGWLAALAELIGARRAADASLLIGCSALKRIYREQLRRADPDLVFLFLDGDYRLILERMRARAHFFSPAMLDSQFATLERPRPDEAIRVDIDAAFDTVVERCAQALCGQAPDGRRDSAYSEHTR